MGSESIIAASSAMARGGDPRVKQASMQASMQRKKKLLQHRTEEMKVAGFMAAQEVKGVGCRVQGVECRF
jgi:hypothetical protein